MISQVDGGRVCTFKTGDAGTGSIVSSLPDNPWGSCYPHFVLVHLVPEPYEDDNETIEPHDTRCTVDAFQQMELYLKAMCEGFVDGQTSKEIICDTGLGNLYDYSFETLCFEAFGGRWIGAFSTEKRPDGPSGFGPLPNTEMEAELFDRLSSAVNLLDKVRLDLPLKFKFRTITSYGYSDLSPVLLRDTTECTESGLVAAYADGQSTPGAGGPPKLPDGSYDPGVWPEVSAWDEWTEIGASKSGTPFGCPFQIQSYRQDTEYRAEVDPDFYDAVPTALLDHINGGGTGFLANYQTARSTWHRESVSEPDADRCPSGGGGGAHWFTDTEQYRWTITNIIPPAECVLVDSGTLIAPALLTCDCALGRTSGMTAETFCATGPGSSAALTLVAEQNAFMKFPLVEGT